MPVSQSIWKVDKTPKRLHSSSLRNESKLEEMICNDMGILNELMDAYRAPSYDGLQ